MSWLRIAAAVVTSAVFLLGIAGASIAIATSATVDIPLQLEEDEASALAQPFIDLMAGTDDAILARFVPGLDHAEARKQFDVMRKTVPSGEPHSDRIAGLFRGIGEGEQLTSTREQMFDDRVVLIETTLVRPDSTSEWKLRGFFIRAAFRSELAINSPSPFGKPPLVLGAYAAMVVILAVVWATAMAILLMKDVRRRWLWFVFSFVGVTSLKIGTNGALGFQPIFFMLGGVGLTWNGSALAPWVISLSVPIGAILFWAFRRTEKSAPPPETVF